MTTDEKRYRVRRGKLVEIPPEWVGKTVHPQTRDKRPSKKLRKLRMRERNWPSKKNPKNWAPRHGGFDPKEPLKEPEREVETSMDVWFRNSQEEIIEDVRKIREEEDFETDLHRLKKGFL